MRVQNPVTALFGTLLWAAVLSGLLLIPTWVFRALAFPVEVPLFYGVAALAMAGAIAGRSGTFAFAAFPTAFIGGLLGYAAFVALVSPPVDLLFALAHALIAGMAAWAVASRKMAKLRREVRLENEEKRRCRMCGARVGSHARRCWSCRASLNRIT